MDWDDLRLVLAVARGGSLSAAARWLGVNHSTVFRRLAALEAQLGVRLFERLPEGYRPSAAGADLTAAAERVEAEMQALDRRLAGRDARLAGSLRLTAPDDVVETLLMDPLGRFLTAYPEVRLEVVVDNRMLSLTRREADVALRPTLEPPEVLVGRRVAPLGSAVYGAPDLAAAARDRPLAELPWVGWDEGSGPAAVTRWIADHVPVEAIRWRGNSLLNQASACRLGLGLAILPCFLGDAGGDLERISGPEDAWNTDLWLLTHPDLRATARVRALMDFLFDDLRRSGQLEVA